MVGVVGAVHQSWFGETQLRTRSIFGRFVPFLLNSFQNLLHTCIHLFVPESQNRDPVRLKIRVLGNVMGTRLLRMVRVSVQLHAKALPRTIEVQDVRPIAVLSAKLAPVEFTVFEVKPEQLFSRRCILAELFAPGLQRWTVVA